MEAKQPFENPHEGDELIRAARRKIDDDIDKLECTNQSLKMKRNELSPTSVLPPEILSRIFIFARDLSVVEFYNHQAPWICVGHVCHRWREVALGCPNLWSVPVFNRPNLAQEMIQRSKMAALTIKSTADPCTPRISEQLQNAMVQINRIQSIELKLMLGRLPGVVKALFSSLSQPATLLEDISLSDTTYLMPPHDQLPFPTEALSNAPCLRSISLKRLNVSWESAVFRHKHLTCLRLSNTRLTTGRASTFGQMMDALHHLPNLCILGLNNSIPSHTASKGNAKPLEFKFLKKLELSAKAVDCIFFLRHIQYPPCATVILRSSSTPVKAGKVIYSLIGRSLRRTQSAEGGAHHSPFIIRSARLTSTTDLGDSKITFFNKFDGAKHLYRLSGTLNPFIKLCLSGDFGLDDRHLLMSLYNCFDLSSLRGLLLDEGFTEQETPTIQDTFGKLPKL